MRNWLIKKLISWQTKLEVLTFEKPKNGFEYFYISTLPDYINEACEWIDWAMAVSSNGTNPLLKSKKDDGWCLIKKWRSIRPGYSDSNYIFERKIPKIP